MTGLIAAIPHAPGTDFCTSMPLCCCEKHYPKPARGEEKGHFILHCQVTVLLTGSQSNTLEAGTCRQGQKQSPWKNATSWLAFYGVHSSVSFTTQDHLPRGLGSNTPIINQENAPKACRRTIQGRQVLS